MARGARPLFLPFPTATSVVDTYLTNPIAHSLHGVCQQSGIGESRRPPPLFKTHAKWRKVCPCEEWLGLAGKGNEYLFSIHPPGKEAVRGFRSEKRLTDGSALLFDVRPSSGPYTDQVVLPPANRLPPHLLS